MPLRYAGGKSLAVGHVVEHIPADIPRLVSPFIGGGSVEIACARELGVEVIGYDIFAMLTNYWQVQTAAPKKLAAALEAFQPTPDCYAKVKATLKAHWTDTRKIRSKYALAAYYWFNHNFSYGPGFLGWMSKIYQCPRRYERLVAKVRGFSCPQLRVQHARFFVLRPAVLSGRRQDVPRHLSAAQLPHLPQRL